MNRLTLKAKIYVMLGFLLAGLAASTIFGLQQLSSKTTRDAEFATSQLKLQDEARITQLTFKKQVQAWKDILLRGSDPESLKKYEGEFSKLDVEVQTDGQQVRELTDDPAIKSQVDAFLNAHAELGKQYRAALPKFESSHGRDFHTADLAVKGKDRPVTDAVDQIVDTVNNNTKRDQQAYSVQLATQIKWMAAGATVFIFILLLAGVYVVRSISRTTAQLISHLTRQASDMREGKADLTKVIRASDDEFGQIAGAFDTFTAAARDIMCRLAGHSEQLASATEEMSSGAGQSAETSRVQSDQTHQVATAMEEMSATVQQISQHSEKAATTSQAAAAAARRGGEVADETLSTMRSIAESTKAVASRITELGKSSEQIGKIIAVIDDIADQTNLLALNAAIEAARAGEQGRGFAVVADEVRKLAERTTKATKEIAAMIESIQAETKNAVQAMEKGTREVQVGVDKTTASGAALEEIIKMSEQVGDMISQIATAAVEQSSASEQINASVSQISSSTQESSATASEMAKACQDLSSLAFDLQVMVSNFKLGEEDRAAHAGRKAPATRPAIPAKADEVESKIAAAASAGQ
ncbi:MAG: methyl-accepting chemotaxis protein [Candidatus Sulfotelmatobacter sp.]